MLATLVEVHGVAGMVPPRNGQALGRAVAGTTQMERERASELMLLSKPVVEKSQGL